MIVINVKENESIDRALKRFKKKFERTVGIKWLLKFLEAGQPLEQI